MPDPLPVSITADLAPRVNLALQQNHVPFFRRLEVRNRAATPLTDVHVGVTSTPAFFAPWTSRIDTIAGDSSHVLTSVPLMLASDFLAAQAEREAGFVEIVVEAGGEVLHTQRMPVDVLSPHEWGGFAMLPELLAAFVRPNADILSGVLGEAAAILKATTGNSALGGYQGGDPKRAYQLAQALYEAVQARGVTYINPPASFEKTGQKVRTHEKVLEHRLGTCLDLTVLIAALMEQSGLNPLLILVEGHAFPGVWLTDFSMQEPTFDDPRPILKRVELGEALVFDSSAVAQGASFEQARKVAEAHLRKDAEFAAAIDVHCARAHEIRPMPFDREGVHVVPANPSRTTGPVPHSATPDDRFRFSPDAPSVAPAASSRIDRWKAKLLDLSLRNRSLNYRATKNTCGLQLVDCASLEDALAGDKSFEVGPKLAARSLEPRLVSGGGELDDDALTGVVREHQGRGLLHTDLAPAEHEKVMTELFRQSRTAFEESGAILLYVTVGMLEWFEAPSSTQPRFAPLVMVPVLLSRGRAPGSWSLKRADDETRVNVTLLKKLEADFGMNVAGLDVLPEDASGVDVPRILHAFRVLVRNQSRWLVHDRSHLGLFSFQKFLMWLDLEAKQAALVQNPVVRHLFSGNGEPFPLAAELVHDKDLDVALPAHKTLHVVDADPSQVTAILAAEAGSSFVLQGPPGTGKSQTITNLIAQLLASGKTVLFVSEKLAALEVVHTRLAKVGLAPFCLELHSSQASKAAVMEQLRASLDVSRQHDSATWEQHAVELQRAREQLNAYAKLLDQPSPFGTSTRGVLAWLFGVKDALQQALPAVDARQLTPTRVAELAESTTDLASAIHDAGGLSGHPWRAVGADDWDPAWQRQVETASRTLGERARILEALRLEVARMLELPSDTPVPVLAAAAQVALDTPAPPAALLEPSGFAERIADLRALLERGRTYSTRRSALLATWDDAILALDVTPIRQKVETWAQAFFLVAWVMLWGTRKRLKLLARDMLPSKTELGQNLRDAEWLRSEAQMLRETTSAAVFGHFWRGPESDWAAAERVLVWASQFRAVRTAIAQRTGSLESSRKLLTLCTDVAELLEPGARLSTSLRELLAATVRFDGALADVEKLLKLDTSGAFGADRLPSQVSTVAQSWLDNLPRLRNWCALVPAMASASKLGLAPLMDSVEAGRLDAAQLADVLDRSLREAWWEDRLTAEPMLRQFRGTSHAELIARFRRLDTRSLGLAQKEVIARVAKRAPGANAPGDEMGLIQRQLKLKRGHLPIRQLFAKIPTTLKRLKPCVLMSPLSVAQYLDPSVEGFDVVVFDEASQIPPWDAVGAIARGKQVIVVGDSKQLPPTSFFDRGDDDDETALDDDAVQDTESILDEMIAARLRELLLKWHYRSKHESLIAFSNLHYYDNRLHTFPSAADEAPELGVKLVKVKGFYDRGGSRTNQAEADSVVAEIFRLLALPDAERPTVGVVTFSQVQQRLVQDLVDKRLQAEPQFQRHFAADGNEPVFVKNLENVQGDERDVMLFSICYGPDATGKVTMNFGPLNRKGGERRLNVAVTRARKRLSVYTTLDWGQIDENKSRATGVSHLKAFLRYAALGPQSLLSTTSAPDREDFGSPFEEEVHRVLTAEGWQVRAQIGCSGYRVDLGIVDPERPGTYLLGIECDGASYHGSYVARERDRLREEVLVSLGWQIHRLWATDWWYDRANATARLLAAVKDAEARTRAGTPPPVVTPIEPDLPQAGPAGPVLAGPRAAWPDGATRFMPVAFLGKSGAREDFDWAHTTPLLADSVVQLVVAHGPIHADTVTRTIATAWGFGRTGNVIVDRIHSAIRTLPGHARPERHGDYFWPDSLQPATWRGFRFVDDGEPRNLAETAPEEIANAAAWVLGRALSISQAELVRETAKAMGVKAVSGKTTSLVESALPLLAASGRGVRDGAKWRVAE